MGIFRKEVEGGGVLLLIELVFYILEVTVDT